MMDDQPKSPPAGALRTIRDDVHLALMFLTRLPLPDLGYVPGGLARAMRLFPLAGAAIGAVEGAVFWAAWQVLPPLIAALAALAAGMILTGGLHEDGLADSADGLGARGGRDKRLEIMRDSHTGTYGAAALFFSLGLRAAALAAAPGAWAGAAALIAAGAVSRALIPAVMQVMGPARPDGLGAGAGQPHAGIAAAAFVIAAIIAFAVLNGAAPPALIAAAIAAGLATWAARRALGGHTGDVLGAVQQCAAIAVLCSLAGVWR